MLKRNAGLVRVVAVATVAVFVTFANTAMARTAAPKSIIQEKPSPLAKPKSDPPKWLDICNRIAPATSVLCSLAPLPTILEVSRTKSVGSLPLLPYSSMAANGFIWALYGVLTDNPAIKWANIMGTVLGAYYVKAFSKYNPPGSSNLPGTITQHMLAVAWIVFANGFIVTNFPKKAAEIVGKEGVLIYIILFASPLAALKNVIETKSADSIPLPFTIASTINLSLWSVVGLLLLNDFNLYFPSMIGLLCALAQLFLKGMYGSNANIETEMLEEMTKLHVHAV
mmetsp:Transcript_6763/g.16640  ORF Transcript_6763/g.16640 Transcript_6763/m.16640 type:complete len:282 (-) Transcript_6763:303-1148(-)